MLLDKVSLLMSSSIYNKTQPVGQLTTFATAFLMLSLAPMLEVKLPPSPSIFRQYLLY